METKLNKKLILVLVKYGSWIMGFMYFIQIILSCFGFQSFILASVFSISIFPIILLCLFSVMLGYCIWNRLPLYYIVTIDCVNAFDYYVGIPIAGKWMLITYLIIAGMFILFGAYKKNRYNVRKRISKKIIS